ncbi:beta strand repeat-containing protein [Stieleria varia]|uniref:Serine-aspartate repeat-containing protein F n=1 Tax=Stieleria varia TaxID=2528005 RepID=A0A5C6AQN7_9BACT|nr:SdrD B-like domain-containing protein [Stieleria varia]TWU02353.1 Serine-aspartate repeat-containing protein F precursor [Stieleria varia]
MAWHQIVQRIARRFRGNDLAPSAGARKKNRRLGMETLAKRELLASDLGAISGISFADLTGNGLSGDDPRLENVTVEIFRDVDASGTINGADGAAIQTQLTDVNGMYFFRGLNQDTFIVRQQPASAELLAPDPIVVTVTDDSGDVMTVIDDFTQTGQVVTADGANPTVPSSAAAPEAIGGFRDILVTRTSGVGILNVAADANDDILSIGSQTAAEGTVLIQYDGNDGSTNLSPTGLGGVSLGGGLPGEAIDPDAGILIQTSDQLGGDTVTVRVYTDAANFAEVNVNIPMDTGVVGFQEDVFVRYTSDFTLTGTPDFNNIGAIEFLVTVAANNDIQFAAFTVRGPNLLTANLPNEQLLTLGGTLFEDLGGGANTNNGLLDGGETGVAGVTVDLYAEPNGGGAIDPANQVAVATTTTDGNGDYSFTGLEAGNYVVVIPESQFLTGAPLFGYATSTGNDPAPDPDDTDTDGDDNGALLAGVGLVTGEVTLTAGAEPINDGDTDPNTNFAVDFGVTPTIDLAVTKTVDAAASTLTGNGTVFFDIDFQNNGPLDASNVVITDTLPAGLTIDQANSDFGTFTPTINGQDISVAIGALALNGTGTIRIAATIANGQTADLTNTAVIAGDEVETDLTNNSDDALVTLNNSDLSVTKSDNQAGASVPAGTQFTYTITVTNNGPDDATNVIATDTLPASTTFVSAQFSTGAGTVTETPAGSGNLVIDVGDLANGASEVIEVTVLVDADSPTPIVNSVTVVGDPDMDPTPDNNTAEVTTPIVRNVDVAIDKAVTGTVTAGANMTYTITATNNGPGVARGVEITDTLDAALTFVSFDAGTTTVTNSVNGQDLTFDVGTLDPNETVVFTFVVGVGSDATADIPNTAVITTTDIDTDTTNNTDTVTVTPGQATDVILTKDVDLATAVPGQDQLVYTFTISHDTDSISDATGVTFTDVLPAGLTGAVISATGATTNFDSNTQTATVTYASIPVGETRTFTITADIVQSATGTITNTGSVVISGTELDTTNNSDTASTNLTPEFDVTITKLADDTTPAPGQNVTYTIGLTNSGPSTATGVILTDNIPTGLTFVSGTLNGQAATSNGTTVTFPSITLNDGATANATLVFTVGVDATGTITNTATVAASAGETNTNNNTATEDITATPTADLTVTKSVDVAATQVGENLTYTITVTNAGVSTAVAATAVDTLPSGVTFVSGTGPNGGALTATNGVVTVNGGNLAPNASFSFTIVASVNNGVTADQINNVSVSTTTNETNTNNNTASATTTIDPVLSSIAGTVYLDLDNDGVQDAGETGIAGVALTLTGNDTLGNAISRSTTTDANGDYLFANLPAGTYRVDQTQPSGFRDGQETVGTGATATAIDNAFTQLGLGINTPAVDFNFGELQEPLSKRRFLASS